jgi:hypothetical protein
LPIRVESRSANLVQQLQGQLGSESIECFIEGRAFPRSYDLAPRPPLPPSLSHQQAGPATHRTSEKERQVADGGGGKGVSEESNHTTARKPFPLLIIQYSLSGILEAAGMSAYEGDARHKCRTDHRRRDVMTTLQVQSP